jgi:putative ABC transport system permease protein
MDERRTAAERRYRRLLRLFPARFRTRFEPDLLDLFRDQHRAAARHGHTRLVLFWMRMLLELVPTALSERLTVARKRCRTLPADSPTARATREPRGARMEMFAQDVRYALRVLVRRPGPSLIVIITLALGIGANTAIFSLVNTVLLRPLPYPHAERLFMIWERDVAHDDHRIPVRPANFFDWRTRVTSFEDVAWSADMIYNVTGDGDPESVIGYQFSANMFGILGVRPLLGRGFTANEDHPGGPHVVVLGYKLWQRRYGADPAVVGRAITLNGDRYTVIGVMPAAFTHPTQVELWTPMALPPATAARRDIHMLRLVGRLKPARTNDDAYAELSAVYRDLAKRFPTENGKLTPTLTQLGDVGDARLLLTILFGAVSFVLLIACANVANMLLADTTSRRREIAMRAALGASRRRIGRQILSESLLLALAGGLIGMVVTWWTADTLALLFPKNISNLDLPLVDHVAVDARVWLFAFGISVLTGVLFGLLPAWSISRGDVQVALKEGDRGGTQTRRMHATLVIAEVALSIVLVAGALLMVRSFMRLQQGQLGFDPDRVLTARVILPQYRYKDDSATARFTRALIDRVRALPGVETVGVTNYLPLSGWWGTQSFFVEGQPDPARGSEPVADFRLATEEYFRAMRIQLLAGRTFIDRDNTSASPVVIVNDTLVRRYFAGVNPVGRRILVDDNGRRATWEIVGVIRDVKSFGLDEPSHAELFRPYWQDPSRLLGITVRCAIDPVALGSSLRQAVWSIDKDQPVTFLMSMFDLASESLAFRRVGMILTAGFGALALVLAAVGIYGVLSYSVTRRTRELGVRMALGATRKEVAALVLRESLAMTVIGVFIGLVSAVAISGYLRNLLFEVQPDDPLTLAAVAMILTLVAIVATCIPARRATAVDPIVALRVE